MGQVRTCLIGREVSARDGGKISRERDASRILRKELQAYRTQYMEQAYHNQWLPFRFTASSPRLMPSA